MGPTACFVAVFALVAVQTETALAIEQTDACKCRTDEGVIDLWPLNSNTGKPRFSEYKDAKTPAVLYSWNPCTDWKQQNKPLFINYCDKGVAACEQADPFLLSIGKHADAQFVTSGGKVYLQYTGKPDFSVDQERTLKIALVCDEDVEASLSKFTSKNLGNKQEITATLSSKYACPVKDRLSNGSILLIIFFTLLLVYLIVGMVFNGLKRDRKGLELLPNRSFWKDLPFLCKDGCVFTFQKIKSWSHCSGREYEKI